MKTSKNAKVLVSAPVTAATLSGLKALARMRKRFVDSLASSIIRQYAQGRLV